MFYAIQLIIYTHTMYDLQSHHISPLIISVYACDGYRLYTCSTCTTVRYPYTGIPRYIIIRAYES